MVLQRRSAIRTGLRWSAPTPRISAAGKSAHGAAVTIIATELTNASAADQDGDGCDLAAGMFGPAVSAWIRKMAADYLTEQRAQHHARHGG